METHQHWAKPSRHNLKPALQKWTVLTCLSRICNRLLFNTLANCLQFLLMKWESANHRAVWQIFKQIVCYSSLQWTPRMQPKFSYCSLHVARSLWSEEYDLKSGPQGRSSFPGPPAGLSGTKAPLSSTVKKLWSPHRAIPVAGKFPVSSLRRTQCLLLIYLWHVFLCLL